MKKHWPLLSYALGKPTYETLQLFTQIVGKIKLATMPWINHSWGVTLHLTPAGLTTQTIPYKSKDFQIDFDLNNHQLNITTSLGESKQFSLENISVAGFYNSIQKKLKEIDIEVTIFTVPSEIVDPIPFEQDESHKTYDKEHSSAFHIALLRINEVFLTYRSGFNGKTSAIHFFWGGFDLSLSFFSGKKSANSSR